MKSTNLFPASLPVKADAVHISVSTYLYNVQPCTTQLQYGSSLGYLNMRTSGMVQVAEAGGKRVKTLTTELLGNDALDLAEELFVSCRFTEAARVCNEALQASSISSSPAPCARSSSGSGDPASSRPAVTLGDQLIAPVGECDTCDLIVAVLLQCGFELRRLEEWGRCRAYYSTRGAMPFAVAILW